MGVPFGSVPATIATFLAVSGSARSLRPKYATIVLQHLGHEQLDDALDAPFTQVVAPGLETADDDAADHLKTRDCVAGMRKLDEYFDVCANLLPIVARSRQ